jgi:phospholipid/cholesterol/gamma-HCH transport system substrate-binding protein
MSRVNRGADALLGVAYLGIAVVLLLVAMLAYDKTFVSSTDVTLDAGAIGNALQKNSDVKLNGVPVGTVTGIRAVDDGSRLTLALDPQTARRLPTDTVARILPKTLFGERYVDLIPGHGGGHLTDGATIHQDASARAVELEQVFDAMLPVLRSIQPDKLAATMGEMATMLRGRGSEIGAVMAQWGAYFHKLNPYVPRMTADLAKLADVATTYRDAAPDLLDALDASVVTMRTVAAQNDQLRTLFANVITSADTTRGWVDRNKDTIIVLSNESRAALNAVRPYATEFPCLLAAARKFVPVMDKTLGKGTGEPGIHVRLQVVDSRGKYLAGKDAPSYLSGKSPRCPYVTGQTGTRAAPSARTAGSGTSSGTPPAIAPPPSRFLQQQLAGAGGMGEANSPAENELIAELLAPTEGIAPSDFPDWASLLAGPLLRNTEVSLR